MDYKQLKEKTGILINQLQKDEIIQFGICCFERIVELYKLFDEKYNINLMNTSVSNGNGYVALMELLDFIRNKLFENDNENVISKINICKSLIPDPEIYDTNAVCYMAELITHFLVIIMEYYINDNKNKVKCFMEYSLEMVNQIKGEEYYQKEENKKSYNVPAEYLEKYFTKELEIENRIITMIKNKEDKLKINQFINNNKIKWNKNNGVRPNCT